MVKARHIAREPALASRPYPSISKSKGHAHPYLAVWLIFGLLLWVATLGMGVLAGLHWSQSQEAFTAACNCHDDTLSLLQLRQAKESQIRKQQQHARNTVTMKNNENSSSEKERTKLRFGDGMSDLVLEAARVMKRDFLETFDGGLPDDDVHNEHLDEVLILYNNEKALPSTQTEATIQSDEPVPKLTALDATEHCQTLHVISTKADVPQCVALVGQYESFHISNWMRVPPGDEKLPQYDRIWPLRPVGRGMRPDGVNEFIPPNRVKQRKHWERMIRYLHHFEETSQKHLKPILQRIARENTIIVMVCNHGQSDLLLNFLCASRSRDLSLKNLFILCTDTETYQLAMNLGVAAYYDELNFGGISSKSANRYGDKIFRDVMWAKVVAVHMVAMLGYDVLFQDVDVVWYKDPLPFLQNNHQDFDLVFQDDGARTVRYAPYFANSGFYFCRNNEKTRYLLTSLVYMGDLIMASGSHQQELAVLLAEHGSLFGLRSKALPGENFPSGYHYLQKPDLMHEIVTGKRKPYLFHINWTENREEKLSFLQQMGLWFVQPQCAVPGEAVLNQDRSCCAADPLVTCHYRDRPSAVPCHDSPAMVKNGKSFWKEEQT